MKKIRLGIIGLGGMGTGHYGNAKKLEGIEVVAVCDIDPSRIEKLEGEKFTDSSALIRSGKVDAVIIATPHYAHTPISIDALNNGLHVLVEKPIAVHANDAQKMIQAHKNKEQVFAIMFQQRTNPAHIKLKEMIQNGELGEIRRINYTITDWFRTEAYYASGGWRATWKGEGGGVLLNQCPHNLDLFQWFFGLPQKVTATIGIGKYHKIEVEDDVTALLEYANGATAVFTTSTGEFPGSNRLEIAGELGKVIFEKQKIIFTKNRISMSEMSRTTKEGFKGPETEVVEYSFENDSGEQHYGVIKTFRDAIINGTPLIARAEEGINSLMLGNAMLLSGLTKKTVELPLDGDLFFSHLERLISTSKYVKPALNKE